MSHGIDLGKGDAVQHVYCSDVLSHLVHLRFSVDITRPRNCKFPDAPTHNISRRRVFPRRGGDKCDPNPQPPPV